jgi:hypothetical protein
LQSPVRITLDGLFTEGQRYFLRYLTYVEIGEIPQTEKIAGTWDLAEFYLENPELRGNR